MSGRGCVCFVGASCVTFWHCMLEKRLADGDSLRFGAQATCQEMSGSAR